MNIGLALRLAGGVNMRPITGIIRVYLGIA